MVPHAAGAAGQSPDARAEFSAGAAKMDGGDHAGAILHFDRVLASLPESEDTHVNRYNTMVRRADASMQAYNSSLEPAHLEDSRTKLVEYLALVERTYADGSSRDAYVDVRKKLGQVEQALEAYRARQAPAGPAPAAAPADGPEPRPQPVPRDDPPGFGLRVAGGILTGVGVGFLGLMGAGLAIGNKAETDGAAEQALDPTANSQTQMDTTDRGVRGNRLAIAGGVIGGATLVAGVVMLAIGLKRRQAALALMPAVHPRGGGASVRMRF